MLFYLMLESDLSESYTLLDTMTMRMLLGISLAVIFGTLTAGGIFSQLSQVQAALNSVTL